MLPLRHHSQPPHLFRTAAHSSVVEESSNCPLQLTWAQLRNAIFRTQRAQQLLSLGLMTTYGFGMSDGFELPISQHRANKNHLDPWILVHRCTRVDTLQQIHNSHAAKIYSSASLLYHGGCWAVSKQLSPVGSDGHHASVIGWVAPMCQAPHHYHALWHSVSRRTPWEVSRVENAIQFIGMKLDSLGILPTLLPQRVEGVQIQPCCHVQYMLLWRMLTDDCSCSSSSPVGPVGTKRLISRQLDPKKKPHRERLRCAGSSWHHGIHYPGDLEPTMIQWELEMMAGWQLVTNSLSRRECFGVFLPKYRVMFMPFFWSKSQREWQLRKRIAILNKMGKFLKMMAIVAKSVSC